MYEFYTESIASGSYLQGDILDSLFIPGFISLDTKIYNPMNVETHNKKLSQIGPLPKDSIENVLTNIKSDRGMIISQSCDIEREERGNLVLICPIYPLSLLESKLVETTSAGDIKALLGNLRKSHVNYWFYLPANDNMQESYADFTIINSIHKDVLTKSQRFISLTPYSRHWLQHSLSLFLARPFTP